MERRNRACIDLITENGCVHFTKYLSSIYNCSVTFPPLLDTLVKVTKKGYWPVTLMAQISVSL